MKIENTQNTQNKQNQKFAKGFTLLELLVVVVIIGILAAIALPQYQMAVGKTKFSELKVLARNFQQSAQRYYMINNTYEGITRAKLDIEMPTDSSCGVIDDKTRLRCCKKIFNTQICLYMYLDTGLPQLCYVESRDTTDKANLLCKKETQTTRAASCADNYCSYYY